MLLNVTKHNSCQLWEILPDEYYLGNYDLNLCIMLKGSTKDTLEFR
jgi:hypothetical protein